MKINEWALAAQIAANVTVILGFPIIVIRYFRATRKEAKDREYGTYNALDDKYLEFQRICLANPRLDIFDIPLTATPENTPEEKAQELVAFTFLMSVFERAYLMYQEQRPGIRIRQWLGWHEYIESYCRRENFRQAWKVSGKTFDGNFQAFMDHLIKSTTQGEP
jgi:hypothetical protein